MKKHNIGLILVGFILIGLFVARFFWSSVSTQTDGENQKLAKLANVANSSLAGSQPSTQVSSDVKSDSASLDKSVAATEIRSDMESQDDDFPENKRERSPLEDCFERLDRQKDSAHFLSKNKEKLDKEIYPWILDSGEVDNLRFPTLKNPGPLLYFNYLYRGLFSAGLLQGSRFPDPVDLSLKQNKIALEQATFWLKKATQVEFDNAAAWVYLAVVYESSGQVEKFNEAMKILKLSKYFHTGITDASRYLYLQMQDGSDFLDVVGVIGALPIPNYTILNKFMIKHRLDTVADLMVKNNDYSYQMKNNIPVIEFADFVLIEYAIGLSALKNLKVQNQYMSMKEYMDLSRSAVRQGMQWNDDEIVKDCDLKTLEKSMHVLKKNLQSKELQRKDLQKKNF